MWDKILEHPTQADDIGCLLAVAIHKANLHDTKMGYWVTGLAAFSYPTLKKICADGGYRGTFVYEAHKYLASITKALDSRNERAETLIKISHIHTLLKRL